MAPNTPSSRNYALLLNLALLAGAQNNHPDCGK
jgi:hypothetical protein